MPSEANTKRAEDLLPCDCDQEDGEHKCPFHWSGQAVAAALDAAEARSAARLRERVREAAERHEFAATVADEGGDFGPDRVEYAVEKAIARVLRGLLEEEG